ncbi:MAG: hypothetical protein WEG56_14405 [Chloroflexota bacterium]
MTVSEFAFLAMGLLLGVAAGAALVEILRARPPAPREVRVTVAQDAIPRRSTTLSDDAFASTPPEPARGGPADRRVDDALPTGVADRRTPVRAIGVSVAHEHDLMLQAILDGGTSRTPSPTTDRAMAASTAWTATAVAVLERPSSLASDAATAGDAAEVVTTDPTDDGPCGSVRRVADERCKLASRARAEAGDADDALRLAQRAYDDNEARIEEATRTADPRAVREAKNVAQRAFRAARDVAQTTDAVEAAAREWLAEVNRINAATRDADAIAAQERASAQTLAAELEQRSVQADAARIAAETAEAACLAAREAAADCDEREAAATAAGRPPSGNAPDDHGVFTPEAVPVGALAEGGTPRIFRLLRGDRSALMELVAAMAGDDPVGQRHWQMTLSDLVDAILAESIAAGTLHFPPDHEFWGPFTLAQARDVTRALSSLGYRFDGLGGWVDGRTPSQRDMSLALGYAGLDPMRVRHWPTEEEMTRLLAEVTVAADEHLAGAAGDLTLGELVTMLGRRADGLTAAWNAWGRLRPLLLEER